MAIRSSRPRDEAIVIAPRVNATQRVYTRRHLLAGVLGFGALGLLAACGGDDDDDSTPVATATSDTEGSTSDATPTTAAASSPVATEAAGEWTFTDDRGVTITLPKRPERVVPYLPIAAALWDFGVHSVGVYGTTQAADGTPEIFVGDIDLDAVESLGEVYGEMDLEALVALQPDLVLFDIYGAFDLWGLPADAVEQVEAIAPIAGISYVERPITETIGRIEELAGLLGADLEAPEVVAARERFDQASADVEAATAEKPELTSIFSAGWTDNFYVANPVFWADLIYFHELGLDIVVPEIDPSELWETLSWEQASKYQVDLILNDARAAALSPEQLAAYPTWMAQPAVKAGQVGEWYTEFVASYAGFATVLESLADTIQNSRADVV